MFRKDVQLKGAVTDLADMESHPEEQEEEVPSRGGTDERGKHADG